MAGNFDLVTKETKLPGGSLVVIGEVSGAIDTTTNDDFDRKMTALLDKGVKNLILDLAEVRYINSTGMGALIKFADSFRVRDGDIKLVSVPSKVETLFEMLGLQSVFKMFPSVKDAIEFLSDKETPVEIEAPVEPEVPTIGAPSQAAGATPKKPGTRSRQKRTFPLHFACPSCKTRVVLGEQGKYKCPKCSAYYSASDKGEVRAIRLEESKLVELKIPSSIRFTDGLKNMVSSYTRQFNYPKKVYENLNQAIDESWALIVGRAEKETDMCQILIVGNSQELVIGFVLTNEPFNIESDEISERAFKLINAAMDQVEISSLPSGGQMLRLVKNI